MAGDWIKFEMATFEKPEVLEMSGALGISQEQVVGGLLRVWFWFDQNTINGHAACVTDVTLLSHLNRAVGVSQFAEAMLSTGWLVQKGDEISMPNFDRHNGKSAKNRALAYNRKRAERDKKVSRSERDKRVTRDRDRDRVNKGRGNSVGVVDTKGPRLTVDAESLSPQKSRQEKIDATQLNEIHRNTYRKLFAEELDAQALREAENPIRGIMDETARRIGGRH